MQTANTNTPTNEIGKVYMRPWGSYQTLLLNNTYQVKIITINSGGQLSLQKHSKRAEQWIIVEGTPTITVDSRVKTYAAGEHIFIAQGAVHRAANTGKNLAKIIEVQIGDYLGEDDIVRLDDIYGRIT